ncbi:TPA: pilus assembly/adherence protein PilC [Neisseria meningitidis]
MNSQKLPEVKNGNYQGKNRQVTFNAYFQGTKKNSIFSFDNTDEVVAQKGGTVVFGAATYLPPYGKVSGFDADKLQERGNAVGWIGTIHPGLVGYSYQGSTCNSRDCPELSYKTQFIFSDQGLKNKVNGKLDIDADKSRDNSPIYKLPDHPWLGVSFNLSSESTNESKQLKKLVSSFSENVTQNNSTQSPYTDINLVYTTDKHRNNGNIGRGDNHAVAFYLNAKLHLLAKKQIKGISKDQTINLGTLKTRIKPSDAWKNKRHHVINVNNWTFEDKGSVSVKLKLPEVKAGRCINKPNPNPNKKDLSPALTAPALWFGAVQNGKAEMYSASVSTYPDSSSSRIFLQNLKRKTDHSKPGRHSLATLNKSDIESKEPSFTGRQTVIRLPGGVYKINSGKNGGRVAGINGNDGKNDTFGILKDRYVTPETNEWSEVLLPWTVRGSADDNRFKTINQDSAKYSQRYRIRNTSNGERNLGDIVNSPIVAVGGYLATSANDGMVHIFKKGNGGDDRSYNLKLSYIPGTMPRKDIESKESTLAKELRAFAEKGYVGDRYGVDGGFVLRQVELSGKKHVFMFGAMGFGGRGAYALDLTKIDSNNLTGVSMFDVQNDKNNNKNDNNRVELGYTVGTPQIGKTHNGKYAAFLASGYATKTIDDQTNKTALYVYDLESSGTLIKKIEVPNSKGGLSSPTLVDKDLDGTVDIAYAGDRGGNMYRFDLSGNNPNSWTVRTIFEGNKPITSAPAISQLKDKRVVIFGTGSDLSEDDVLSTSEQYIYGIFDDDTVANNVNVKLSGLGGGLLEQKLSEENKTLFLTDYKRSDGSGDKGWVVKLKDGQRVTVKPTVVLRTAFVTIHKYTGTDKCGAETAILGINTADGGKLTKKSARPIVPEANTAVAQYSGHKQTANGKSIPIGCMEKDGGTVCPNGYVYDKPVNVRYLDEKKTDGFSTTADGDAGGSGIDPDGKRSGKNNRCFSQKGVRTLLMNDLDSLDITGPTCGMKRISWREVFF